MADLVTNPDDPRLGHGVDAEEVDQNKAYLILPQEERKQGFVRPVRRSYYHVECGYSTRMAQEIAETYARDPLFYGATYCVHCRKHLPVGEFRWVDDDKVVGS